MSDCLFCKIAAGEIPAKKVFEDDDVIAFHDIHPVAPVHLLLVPKIHIDSLAHATAEHQALLGKMLLLTSKLAAEQGLSDGYRTIINTGHGGGQTFFHLHMHIIGGTPLSTHVSEISTQ
ncbi:histidine triad nucleotide-binding protein [Janthinobacterium sp. B9-8]|uniref:histidine triad nucleotide-binding protein n=1 Tax=Janthinobacterium sp. B9-8 TaxID=1236179 RepID=UPI00061CF326|nr:histidine triad nucleotide-binding protein [Janthinobacterium sp. B9-8]AMC36395.1 histidine triad nucleotide-binding protein [Janthinobacterium sp. B9-8]